MPLLSSYGFANVVGTFTPVLFSIGSDVGNINEGDTINFTIAVSNVPDGTTFYWSILSTFGTVNSSDFSSSSNGSFTLASNQATVSLTLRNDLTTEGPETFKLQIREDSVTGRVLALSFAVDIGDTSLSPPYIIHTTAYSSNNLVNLYIDVGPTSGKVASIGEVFVNNDSNNRRVRVLMHSSTGSLLWAKEFSISGAIYNQASGIILDSSDNVHFLARSSGSTGGSDLYIVKLNSSGTILWQQKIAKTGTLTNSTITPADGSRKIALDSSNNVYIYYLSVRSQTVPYDYKLCVAKYNSSGTIQWNKTLYRTQTAGMLNPGSTDIVSASGMAVDPSGNVYITAQGSIGQTTLCCNFIKLTTGGSISYQKQWNDPDYMWLYNLEIDSVNGMLYASGFCGVSPNTDLLIKMNASTGAVQWTRGITNYASGQLLGPLTLGSDGFLYVTGPNSNSISKWDTNGTLIWENVLSVPTRAKVLMYADPLGTVLILPLLKSDPTGNSKSVILKLPIDNSKFGTFTAGSDSITYTVGTRTSESKSTVSQITGAMVLGNFAGTSVTASFTVSDVTGSMINTVAVLP